MDIPTEITDAYNTNLELITELIELHRDIITNRSNEHHQPIEAVGILTAQIHEALNIKPATLSMLLAITIDQAARATR